MPLFALEDVTAVRSGRTVFEGLELALSEGVTAVLEWFRAKGERR